MKTPKKSELYAQIEALTQENIKLLKKLNEAEQRIWLERKPYAVRAFYSAVPFAAGRIRYLTLDHVDSSGYWFTFSVDDSIEKQTYCVRHTDL